ncbi:uncharacterized protein LOC121405828 [Lytechinus variegatus]|uniref:uncharacterized protein LOC121405828 n=1 Tax=Lytechinus variegatus TaxID=7654 RepID=UPI001BB12181|nr:uncharacterized protein LOC121405828 [Lytechinus variegatus]
MNDTLATINVDQLSNAVNAVVQSTALGQVPLDPSPPPDDHPDASPPFCEGGKLPSPGVGTTQVVQPCPSYCGRTFGGRLAEGQKSIPASSIASQKANIPVPTHQQSTNQPVFHTQTSQPSGPVVLVPNPGVQAGQRAVQLQQNSVNNQPQDQGPKKFYMLKQSGSNWVLVPTQAQIPPPIQCSNDGLLKTVTRNSDPITYRPSSGFKQAAPISVSLPTTQSTSLPTVQPPNINMNIAIHLPNNGTPYPIPGLTKSNGPQQALQPIRTQMPRDSTHLLSQPCTFAKPTVSPKVNIGRSTKHNAPVMILPNTLRPSQLRPLTSQVGPFPSQISVLPTGQTGLTTGQSGPCQMSPFPQVSVLPSAQTGLTTGQTGQSEVVPMPSSSNVTVPSVLRNSTSVSNINLFSPPLNFGSQIQMLSPLTSQKGCHNSNSLGGLTNSLDLQPSLLNQGLVPEVVNLQPQQISPGVVKLTSGPPSISHRVERSKVITSRVRAKSRNESGQQNRKHKIAESWCISCRSIVKCCPHQKPAVVVTDKAVETRARQSLPDLLMLKPSIAIPGETGVYAKQEILPNTRFGPVVGKLADVNSSTDLDAIGQKAWRIFSDRKLCQLLFTNDESCSNWMMFIKMSKDHNLMAFQSGAHIYFTSLTKIQPGEELVVWYSKEYARLRGIRDFKGTTKCQKCHQSFPGKTHLQCHMAEAHPSSQQDKMYKCDVCSYVFSSSSKLRTHLLTHLGVKPHRCKICHKGFTDRSNLRAHSLIHAGVKKFTCETCSKSFRQKAHLVSHQITHTGKRDLQCFVCERMFGRQSDLSYHMKQHRETKKLSCPVCDRRFYKDCQLIRHMKIHSGQRDYQCHICNKGFITKYHLSRHLKSCERYERFRRKSWPNSLDSIAGVVGQASGERQFVRPIAPGAMQEIIPARRRRQPPEGQEGTSSRILRSSRGRPIKPKPVPSYMAQLVSPPARGLGSAKRKKRVPRKVSQLPNRELDSGSLAHTVSVTLYEVQPGNTQEIGPGVGPPTDGVQQMVQSAIPEKTKPTIPPDHSSSMSVYAVQGETSEGSTNMAVDQQQQCSTLSQLAISVPQESSIVLDCDNYVSSSSVAQPHLQSSYAYTSSDPQGDDGIHDGSLTTPLFDLGEGPTMSSAVQVMPTYNSQSFSLEEEEDSHSDAFAGPQEHCNPSGSFFMTDAPMSDPVASSSSQSLRHQTHVDSLAEDNHAGTFAEAREHCPPAPALFMTDTAMPDSVASTSSQNLGHGGHRSSLTEDSLFSMDPSDETGTSLSQHTGDSIDDISVDLRAIERALDSDEEEPCTDERRGDSPSENIEE